MSESTDQGRNVAILSYLWIPGWIIAMILNGQRRTSLGSFHVRQALGVWLFSLLIPIRWTMVSFGIITAVMWLIGLIAAAQEDEKPIPWIGQYFQDWFKGI